MDYETALKEWSSLLTHERVLTDPSDIAPYQANTESIHRSIPAILLPLNVEEVIKIVNIANCYKIPIYPISTGHNWGYGSACPVKDHCVIIDLSRMNRIIHFDEESGLITLEPGVTQQQLYDFLITHQYPYLVPTTGGGPTCSILANALERGFGFTPYFDHFGAITNLEAVLANGEIYQTPLTTLGGKGIDEAFKWGIGPYLDGLFSQGNFGIVTKMTIALAQAPASSHLFMITLKKESLLDDYVLLVRDIMKISSPHDIAINLMNAKRILSMQTLESAANTSASLSLSEHLERLLKENRIGEWTIMGTALGKTKSMLVTTKKELKKCVKKAKGRILFFTPKSIDRLQKLAGLLPFRFMRKIKEQLYFLEQTLKMVNGLPGEVALPLAYLKSGNIPSQGINLNPALDGCGLIWYSPLIEMKPQRVKEFLKLFESTCKKFGIEPLITLTALSSCCLTATIPLLFDLKSEATNGYECYKALFLGGKKEGFLPYRVGIQTMGLLTQENTPYWQMVSAFKQAIDPNNILAPGRYAP